MQWDKTLSKIVEQIAEEKSVEVSEVKDAVETFFKLMRRAVEQFHYVRIENFGRFYPSPDIIYYKLKNIIKRYKKDKNRAQFEKDFRKWWRLLELARQNNPRKKRRGWRATEG